MRPYRRIGALVAAAIGVLLGAVGVVYLTVACQNLPGILGPHAGDTAPRTGLGILALILAAAALAVATIAARRRPPAPPQHP